MKTSLILSDRSAENLRIIGKLIDEKANVRIIATSLEITKELLIRIDKDKSLIIRDKSGHEQELIFIKK
jgi:hypothetical protein